MEESQRVRWLTRDEVRDRMAPAYAVRVLDALDGGVSTRSHDGVQVVAGV